MILAIYFTALLALTGWLIWIAADRIRDYFIIGVLTVALFPLLATTLTGDVSLYLPTSTFSAGIQGKDEVIVASALTTFFFAAALAAIVTFVVKVSRKRF